MGASARPGRSRERRRRSALAAGFVALVVAGSMGLAGSAAAADDGGVSDRPILGIWEVQSLNGVNNNPFIPNRGKANSNYIRVAPTRYVDGKSQPFGGPNSRRVSNREFNDTNVNVFSERNVTQWGFVWGQFLDHTFGLRLGRSPGDPVGEQRPIPFDPNDPMEDFTNTVGNIPFERSAPAPGTGVTNARQQVNTVSSYIEASAVYGDTDTRLDWLREGSQDGNPDNNGARFFLPSNYLPRASARGNTSAAPVMELNGRLLGLPGNARVAGDVRANENIGLLATHTLFAREHNRIVSQLPSWVSQYDKYQIARVIVAAEQQYITFNEFLPAIGVNLPSYQGYNPNVNPTLGNEFATVGYRAHSQIHGEFELETNVSRYSQATLDSFEAQGLELTIEEDDIEIAVPLNLAFFNPDLLQQLQLGPMLQGIGLEPQYNNDEQIDNQLRSVLFQIPVPGNPECLDGPTLPECFRGVVDLGAIDVERGRDHGMPTYNTLRAAYGLSTKSSFTAITGESTEAFPPGLGVNSPACLDIIALFDIDGNPTNVDADNAVRDVRRCTTAAMLKGIYGSVSNLDAFSGMLAEPHLAGTEFGALQLAIWKKQFQALRDGDRFHYRNDPLLPWLRDHFGLDYRKRLGDVIAANTDIPRGDLNGNVFFVAPAAAAAAAPSTPDASAATAEGPTVSGANGTTARSRSDQAGANGGRNNGLGKAAALAAGAVVSGRTAGRRRSNKRRPLFGKVRC